MNCYTESTFISSLLITFGSTLQFEHLTQDSNNKTLKEYNRLHCVILVNFDPFYCLPVILTLFNVLTNDNEINVLRFLFQYSEN